MKITELENKINLRLLIASLLSLNEMVPNKLKNTSEKKIYYKLFKQTHKSKNCYRFSK